MDYIREAIKKIDEINERQEALSGIAFDGLKNYVRELDEDKSLDYRAKFMRVYGYIEAFKASYDRILDDYEQQG